MFQAVNTYAMPSFTWLTALLAPIATSASPKPFVDQPELSSTGGPIDEQPPVIEAQEEEYIDYLPLFVP